jgi:CO dehydrogenase/acetyl-CoA synthase alpha subunit
MLTLYVDNSRLVDCIQGYATRDQQNTIARTTVADTERAAFLVMLTTVVNPKSTPAIRKDALDGYIELVQKDDRVRKENPPLPVPTECN